MIPNHSSVRASAVSLRKPAVVSYHSARVEIDAINYLQSAWLKWKHNFPTVAKSGLVNLYLNQEYQNSSISLTTNLRSYSWKISCYQSKVIVKYSQGAAQKTAREKIKKARREEAKERPWANFTKGHSAHLWTA